MPVTRTAVLAALILSAAMLRARAADGQAPAATGGVEGDVYLTMQSGDVRKGAGLTVYLLADNPLLHAGRDSVCVHNTFDRLSLVAQRVAVDDSMEKTDNKKLSQQLFARDVALSQRLDTLNTAMRAQIDRLIAQSVRDTTGTGMNAHYHFENEPPGNYIIYATWTIGENDYTWWHPIELRAGQTAKRDLDSSGAGNELDFLIHGGADMMSSRLYCIGPRIGILPR